MENNLSSEEKFCLKGQSELIRNNSNLVDTKKPCNDKPNILKAILSGLLCLLIFSLTRTLAGVIIALIIYTLSVVPVLKSILSWFFFSRGDLPISFTIFSATTIAYFFTTFVQGKLINDTATKKTSRKLLGITILIFHILCLILNILSAINGENIGTNIWTNISLIIYAFFFICQN